ncbi:MAG: sugar kinase, partial [Flavobacteriaceae bacterium]|nr:sugar kinase [Flavobacteriaceae bacterium]
MSKLLIVGTVAFDAIETPFGQTDKILGGAATFIGLAASQFKVESAIVSVVGGDFPKDYLRLLSDREIDISGIEVIESGKTFFWSGRYHNDMNTRDTLSTELNVLAKFDPKVPVAYKNAEILMLGNLHPKIQKQVLDQMEVKPKLTILDTMNFWMEHSLDELHLILKEVDVITINDEEARQLTHEYS